MLNVVRKLESVNYLPVRLCVVDVVLVDVLGTPVVRWGDTRLLGDGVPRCLGIKAFFDILKYPNPLQKPCESPLLVDRDRSMAPQTKGKTSRGKCGVEK
jgi:hypothetical protein